MGWVVNATPRPPHPRERPGTYCIRGWVGPRAGLDGCEKYRPPPGFDHRTVQPVASRYTDYAILALIPLYPLNIRAGAMAHYMHVSDPKCQELACSTWQRMTHQRLGLRSNHDGHPPDQGLPPQVTPNDLLCESHGVT